jgi:mannosyltransferase
MTHTPTRHGPGTALKLWSPLVLVLLLAAGLRFYALGTQSFWNDEGNTARLIERPITLILEGAAGDVHPPGYYLVLSMWRLAAGQSEFALRAYSALCGILTVAVTAGASRRLGTSHRHARLASWTAAGLVALHPLAVYYSQEARMYAQLGLVSALTLWTAMALVGNHQRRRGSRSRTLSVLGLAACITAGLYTQYTYLLVLVGLNLAFALDWGLRRPWSGSLLLHWVAAHALGGLLFLPWAPIAIGAGGWRPPDLGSAAALEAMGQALLVGVTQSRPLGTLPVVAAVVLVCAALWASRRTPRTGVTRFGIWAAVGMLVIPPLLIAATGMYRPAYLKFLISCISPAAVALTSLLHIPLNRHAAVPGAPARAGGLQVTGLLLITCLVPGQIEALHHLYNDPAFARDDYRSLAASIAEAGRPGDAILLNAPNQWEVFTYYYRGPLPVYTAPYRPAQHEAEGWVAGTLAPHAGGRLFVLFWGDRESDPDQFIEGALAQQAYKAEDRWVTSIRLALYGVHSLPTSPGTPMDIRLDESVRLQGYDLPETVWRPGDVVPLTLFWSATVPLPERYKVFVHLIDAAGTLVGQTDMEPHTGFRPTPTWVPGEALIDRYGVALPSDIVPGDYTLHVGMYRFSGERLPVTKGNKLNGDFLRLVPITVAAPQ